MTRVIPRSLTALAFLLCAFVPALHAEPEGEVRSFEDLEFAKTPEKALLLDLFVPASAKPPPLVVYIHGGSWINGSRKGNPMRWLSDQGFAVASISYRFSAEAKYPAQIHDSKAAIRWLRAHAGEYGYDAAKIGVIGSSAGAHLAVLLGTTGGITELEGTVGIDLGQDSRVQAVVDFFGATDLLLRAETQPAKTDPPTSPVFRLLGASPRANQTLARWASGAFHVTRDDAPLLIYHGEKDATVLPDQSRRIEQVYREGGLEVVLHTVPEGGHSLKGILTSDTKAEIVAFLDRHLR